MNSVLISLVLPLGSRAANPGSEHRDHRRIPRFPRAGVQVRSHPEGEGGGAQDEGGRQQVFIAEGRPEKADDGWEPNERGADGVGEHTWQLAGRPHATTLIPRPGQGGEANLLLYPEATGLYCEDHAGGRQV